MNILTLEEMLKSFESFRRDVLSGEYDTRMILTDMLSFLVEQVKYEIEKNKTSDLYK